MDKRKLIKVIDIIDEDIIKEAEIKAAPSSDTENDNGIVVSGVEPYRGAIWRRLAVVVSVVMLMAGVGAGGALMLKKRPPLLDENAETTTDETTEVRYVNVTQNKNENSIAERTEATTEKASEEKQKETKESKDISSPIETENNDTEETTSAPREENNEPEERENAVTGAKTTQLPVLTTTVTKAQTSTKNRIVTTAIEEVPPPKIITTEPVTERTTPEHPPGYIPTLTWNPEDGEWINNMLSSLAYTPWEYDFHVDGRPPEAYIKGSDGNSYELYFTLKAVNRNGRERAPMPDEIYNYFGGSRYANYPLY
ncbi:hypothetical protein [Ruminococcus sp.]|uniref:hypothetical protein n=1 Tax=Ruminococcus sp. TaxID=41978 RepID=UPI0025D505CF|nr:hypothetical protein [Ruminococcus sp.]MCR4637911.1 hypothetical protein [Ruminococcus sp.]